MHICIISTSENVDEVRARGVKLLPNFSDHKLLKYPLSKNGKLPATHWLCTFMASDDMAKLLMDAQDLSEVALEEPRSFLRKKHLRIIKKKNR